MNSIDRDILISRAVEGRATPEDWRALGSLASHDAALWTDLALSQRDHAAMALAASRAGAAADRVNLPAAPALATPEQIADEPMALITRHREAERVASERALAHRHQPSVMRLAGTWAGWAAAAAIAVYVGVGMPANSPSLNPVDMGSLGNQASFVPVGGRVVTNADEARNAFLDYGKHEGQVLGELGENILIDTKPAADGTVEMIFVRPIVERVRAKDLYRLGMADTGQPVRVRIDIPKPTERRWD